MVVVSILYHWFEKLLFQLFLLTLKGRLYKKTPDDFIPPQHLLSSLVNLTTQSLWEHPTQAQEIVELLDKEKTPNLQYFKYYIDADKKVLDQFVQLDLATKRATVHLKNRQDTSPVKLHLVCDPQVLSFIISGEAPGNDIFAGIPSIEAVDQKRDIQKLKREELPRPRKYCLTDMKVGVTGKLVNYSRDDMLDLIYQHCHSNFVKDVGKNHNLVVIGQRPGPTKIAKLKIVDAKIIDENGFIQLLRNLSEKEGSKKEKSEASEDFLSLVSYLDVIIPSRQSMFHYPLYDIFKREVDFPALELLHVLPKEDTSFRSTLTFPAFLKRGTKLPLSLIYANEVLSQHFDFIFKHIFLPKYRPKFISCRDDQNFLVEMQTNVEWMDYTACSTNRYIWQQVYQDKFDGLCFPNLKCLYYEVKRNVDNLTEELFPYIGTGMPNLEHIWLVGCFRGKYDVFSALTKLPKLKEVHFFDFFEGPTDMFGGFDETFKPSNPLLGLISNRGKVDVGKLFARLECLTLPLVKETYNFPNMLLLIKSLPIRLNVQVSHTLNTADYQGDFPPFENPNVLELAKIKKVFTQRTSFPLSCYNAFPEIGLGSDITELTTTTWNVNVGLAKADF